MKKLLFLLLIPFAFQLKAQPVNCTLKPPVITIHFGTGNVRDVNTEEPYNYERVQSYCPSDGHYTYTSYTSDCFGGDWFTLTEDHTPGDAGGNMMLVNAAPNSGVFLTTTINGLKSGTTYEFAAWMMNVCKISDKCPFPLLPSIMIRLHTPEGKMVAQFGIGELARRESPAWSQNKGLFTTPPSTTALVLTMIDNAPGGCGNDFVLDDVTFRECVKIPPVVTTAPKTPAVVKQKPATTQPALKKPAPAPVNKPAQVIQVAEAAPKKTTPPPVKKQPEVIQTAKPVLKKVTPEPEKRQTQVSQVGKPQTDLPVRTAPVIQQRSTVFLAPPPVLTKRTNTLIKQIETEAGEISLKLYDNGEIDGDTVSIYHNNALVVSHARLSLQPISFRIAIDSTHPHHELIMVAENLGSIPPNTSVMIVNAGSKRYEVFISSSEQKNAKVVFDLKE